MEGHAGGVRTHGLPQDQDHCSNGCERTCGPQTARQGALAIELVYVPSLSSHSVPQHSHLLPGDAAKPPIQHKEFGHCFAVKLPEHNIFTQGLSG